VEFALPASVVVMPSAAAPPPTIEAAPATRPLHPAETVPASQQGKPSRNPERGGKPAMHEPSNEDPKARGGLRSADAPSTADNPLQQFEDMTSAAAKAAKDYRSWMLEQVKINMCAALSYANGLSSMGGGALFRPETASSDTSVEKDAAAAENLADAYRAKAFELMTTNMRSTLEYAQRLVNVKTPTEFVELSAGHARNQFELIMRQTAELGALAQKLAMPGVEAMTAGLAKTLRERKE
jgi:hypothetical protein